MGDPYRETDESSDREGLALIDLGQRRTRLRSRILFVFLVAGVALGVPGYMIVREIQFAMAGIAFPKLSAAIGFFVPFVGCGAAGLAVARRMIRLRMNAWLDEVSRHYKVKRDRLTEVTDLLEAAEGT